MFSLKHRILELSVSTVIAFAAALSAPLLADDPPATPQVSQTACQDDPAFGQWDFWVGEWKVYGNNEERQFFGNNSITKHYANCLIKETWVDANGNGGFSVNFYNPVRKQWRQVWVANGYSIDYTGGLNEEGQMVLEGEIDNYGPGNSQGFRGIWTPQENGDVLQRFEALNAETGNWDVWFEGVYVRQEGD